MQLVYLGQCDTRYLTITLAFAIKLLVRNLSVSEILEAYPELELEDIRQIRNYAAWTV
jgi:uncharacterized protein (DUF433 family)